MTDSTTSNEPSTPTPRRQKVDPLVKARIEKLQRWRETYGITGYGGRVEGLITLAEARALFDEAANAAYEQSVAAHKEDESQSIVDDRPIARVAGRCVQHREFGKLAFPVLRDHSGDLQISVSKAGVEAADFKIAQKLDYGDIIVVEGPVGKTQKGEICIWATSVQLHCKSLAPPPEKWHGLNDPELRYRQRYVDMYINPETLHTFRKRSEIMRAVREFMDARQFMEVDTPVMQPIPGGAAARPFITHHNALDMKLYMRIAPELYLKRLLVGGLPRVYEIARNFRNEGIDRSHNPEFTMMEVYEAYGDCWTMLELTESLVHVLAVMMAGDGATTLPFGDLMIDYGKPFDRISYGDLFERGCGFAMTDEAKLREAATQVMSPDDAKKLDHWLIVDKLFGEQGEAALDPTRPTFVTDYPSAISPLTRPNEADSSLAHRWELFIAGMEFANAYTELNDPLVQRAKFEEQLAGADDEDSTFRTLDEDFLNALMVGMPPAGGLGVGLDRLFMVLTNQASIRDVILFPLLRSEA